MKAPTVITSINPFARLDYQLRCFRAWEALGFDVRTVNCLDEIERLRAAGLPGACCISVKDNETGLGMFGKPLPRIRGLLDRIEKTWPDRLLILVNSDIYPAARSRDFVQAFLGDAGALALTREEVSTIESTEFSHRAPYRGGLDIFLIAPEPLVRINAALGRFAVSERMCFGVPGWDYMLGSVILSDEIGGSVLDSGLLLHEKHQQSYGTIDEFQQYVGAMQAMGAITTDNFAAAAAEFAARIQQSCIIDARQTESLRATYFRQPRPQKPTSPEALRICRCLFDLAPWVRWNYNFHLAANLTQLRLDSDDPYYAPSEQFFVRSPCLQHRFGEALLCILFELLCRPGHVAQLKTAYPKGNRHTEAVRLIQGNLVDNAPLRRLEFANMFGHELLDSRILNTRLYDYLCLACENEHERALMAELGATLRNERHAA